MAYIYKDSNNYIMRAIEYFYFFSWLFLNITGIGLGRDRFQCFDNNFYSQKYHKPNLL